MSSRDEKIRDLIVFLILLLVAFVVYWTFRRLM